MQIISAIKIYIVIMYSFIYTVLQVLHVRIVGYHKLSAVTPSHCIDSEKTEWEGVPDISEPWSNTSLDEINSGEPYLPEILPPLHDAKLTEEDESVDKKWTRIFEGATDSLHITIVGTTANQLQNTHRSMAGRIKRSDNKSTNRAIVMEVISNKEDGVSARMMQHGTVHINIYVVATLSIMSYQSATQTAMHLF